MAPEESHRLRIGRTFADPEWVGIVADAVAQEEDTIDGERARASVERSGATLQVTIEAADARALRAAKRTWLSLVATAERTVSVVEDQ